MIERGTREGGRREKGSWRGREGRGEGGEEEEREKERETYGENRERERERERNIERKGRARKRETMKQKNFVSKIKLLKTAKPWSREWSEEGYDG